MYLKLRQSKTLILALYALDGNVTNSHQNKESVAPYAPSWECNIKIRPSRSYRILALYAPGWECDKITP